MLDCPASELVPAHSIHQSVLKRCTQPTDVGHHQVVGAVRYIGFPSWLYCCDRVSVETEYEEACRAVTWKYVVADNPCRMYASTSRIAYRHAGLGQNTLFRQLVITAWRPPSNRGRGEKEGGGGERRGGGRGRMQLLAGEDHAAQGAVEV